MVLNPVVVERMKTFTHKCICDWALSNITEKLSLYCNTLSKSVIKSLTWSTFDCYSTPGWRIHFQMGLNPLHSNLILHILDPCSTWMISFLIRIWFDLIFFILTNGPVLQWNNSLFRFCTFSLVCLFLVNLTFYNLASLHSMWKDIISVTGLHCEIHKSKLFFRRKCVKMFKCANHCFYL